MKAILILVSALAAISSCAHKSEALQHAEATRRAEVHEAKERKAEVSLAQKEEQKRFTKAVAPASPDVAVAVSARAAEVTIAPERAAFQRASRERLAALEAGVLALRDRVAVSTMPGEIRDATGKGAADLRAQVIALEGRLTTVVESTPNASWSMTKDSFNEQLNNLEDQLEMLDATL